MRNLRNLKWVAKVTPIKDDVKTMSDTKRV